MEKRQVSKKTWGVSIYRELRRFSESGGNVVSITGAFELNWSVGLKGGFVG